MHFGNKFFVNISNVIEIETKTFEFKKRLEELFIVTFPDHSLRTFDPTRLKRAEGQSKYLPITERNIKTLSSE